MVVVVDGASVVVGAAVVEVGGGGVVDGPEGEVVVVVGADDVVEVSTDSPELHPTASTRVAMATLRIFTTNLDPIALIEAVHVGADP